MWPVREGKFAAGLDQRQRLLGVGAEPPAGSDAAHSCVVRVILHPPPLSAPSLSLGVDRYPGAGRCAVQGRDGDCEVELVQREFLSLPPRVHEQQPGAARAERGEDGVLER